MCLGPDWDPPAAQQASDHPFVRKQTATEQDDGCFLTPCWQQLAE